MKIKEDTEAVDESAPSVETLRLMRDRARAEVRSREGVLKRARHAIRYGWLWLLLQAARATWKRILGIMALIFAAVLILSFKPLEEEPTYGLDHDFAIESPEFLSTISGATDTPFVQGNRIEILSNGDQFYPSMLAGIEQAQKSITIEAYIYWAGDIGRRFADALAAKAGSGLEVKILLDAVGSSSISDEIMETLVAGGCQVRWYRPVRWYTIRRFNNRTHRKSLIIDGRIGYTGGAGIADHWKGNAEDPEHWRDTQIRLEGPATATLQAGFARNWLETTGELISGETYYPIYQPAGPLALQSILSSPETGSSTVRIMYYLSIVCARKSIFIANPYFIPDDQAIRILAEAKQRGVDVKIMVAGKHNDNFLAHNNSTRLYGKLLEAGVEIYEYNKTMMHHKYMVCDGVWSTVGTTNFDNRSFALNDENNVCIYEKPLADHWSQIFFGDMANCDLVDLQTWKDRGVRRKVAEFMASFVRDQV
ncbi:MAG TPA: phospholipase D-like domain-containing protein [Blastocatellia bacterium]|nr:phospholipase D-like domain-containing protein [Blastocatellia bacterium]